MSSAEWGLDLGETGELADAIASYEGTAADALSEVIHGSGELIQRRITELIHPSGRTFKGHSASAAGSSWARFDMPDRLSVTVRTRYRYHYLYFPDDGSDTRRHVGGQDFMRRGAENATSEIIDNCLKRLTEDWS